MTYSWSKSILPIAAIFAFRMLGLFMLIPVFSVLALNLDYATPTLIGIALGCYGLSQGLLQIPFGVLSDRYGRKQMITIGLLLFAAGSILAVCTHSIYGMIVARIVQGSGAIGSVLIALLADLTPTEQRTKAMAILGMAIGLSFSIAIVISPFITQHFGLVGLFYVMTFLALAGLVIVHTLIPTPNQIRVASQTTWSLLQDVVKNKKLYALNAGIFFQHLIFTATFFALPLCLHRFIEQGAISQQWRFYLPLILGSFLLMLPFIFWAEKRKKFRSLFIATVATIGISQLLLAFFHQQWASVWWAVFLYFLVFNILEASLPSMISKKADAHNKGTAMGVYSSCQFLGIFVGGLSAGLVYQHSGITGVFVYNALISLAWLFVVIRQ